MKDFLFIILVIVAIVGQQMFHAYQTRNIDNLDNANLGEYAEYINATGQLHNLDRHLYLNK